MRKFKNGDRVVVTNVAIPGDEEFYCPGDTGTVIDAYADVVQFDRLGDNVDWRWGDGQWHVTDDELDYETVGKYEGSKVAGVGPGTPGGDVRSLLAARGQK